MSARGSATLALSVWVLRWGLERLIHAWVCMQDPTFQPMRNNYGAVWEASQLPAPPLDLALTDATGHIVIARSAG